MANKCAGCKRFISAQNGIKCTGCNCVNHFACVGLPEGAKVANSWRCLDCKIILPRQSNNAGTPVRSVTADCEKSQSSSADENCSPTNFTAKCNNDADIAGELKLFREEMRGTRLEMLEFRSTIVALTATSRPAVRVWTH